MLINYFHRNLYIDYAVSILEVVELDDNKCSVVSNHLEIKQKEGFRISKETLIKIENKVITFLKELLASQNNKINTLSVYWYYGNSVTSNTIELSKLMCLNVTAEQVVHILLAEQIKQYSDSGINIIYNY